uniref:RanBP2-type domain-containing protein n=1 Tax=Rhizophora mucronata TaxID=61149 RepID=A0A2P2NGG0_RHIMU
MNTESSFVHLTSDRMPGSEPNNDATNYAVESAMWKCGMCTLFNPPLAPICGLCSAEKPKDVGTKYKTWQCRFCTLENSVKSDKCSACDQWRYSYGQPVSTPAPNVGT